MFELSLHHCGTIQIIFATATMRWKNFKISTRSRRAEVERKEKGGTKKKGFSGAREVRLIDRRTPARRQIPKDQTFPITVNMQPRHWFNVTGAKASVPQ